jgi:replicative DNA helicase
MAVVKPEYTPITREEAEKIIADACQELSDELGHVVHPSGLPPGFPGIVQEGIPQLNYWSQNSPSTWLTDEEFEFDDTNPDIESDPKLQAIEKRIMEDPVKWVEWEFGIVCREHQAQFLRSEAKNRVMRISRRGGKTWALVMYMLWYIFTHDTSEVILLAPAETQIVNIYQIMKNNFFASRFNRHFKKVTDGGIIISQRKKPSYTVEIESIDGSSCEINANVISEGIRGKGRTNTLLVFDEFDFMMNEDHINAVMAIQTQDPNISAIIASTPSGRRGMYWRFCTDRTQGYEEHNWTVWETNPVWSVRTAILQVIRMPWNTYLQEYEAQFGEETTGWLRKELIDEACEGPWSDFYNNQGPVDPGSPIRTMGVDWDKYNTAGPSIVILELDRVHQKMKVIHSEIMPRAGGAGNMQEYTLGNAVQRVIDLNRQYNPHFIYVDRGMGERQVEELWEYGELHPETGLDIKVHGIHFGSKIETIDWVTGEKVKKNIKQVMASEMRVWFEERRIIVSMYDTMLRKQLENYRIVGVTQAGYRFNDDEEHLVDSLMLAIHAVTVHFDELFQKWVPISVMSVNKTVGDMYGEDRISGIERSGGDDIEGIDVMIAEQGSTYYDPGRDMEYDRGTGQVAVRGSRAGGGRSAGGTVRRRVWG